VPDNPPSPLPASQAFIAALGAAARSAAAAHPATHADRCLAVVHLLAVVKEGTYVKVLKRCHFTFRGHTLAHDTTSTAAAAAHRCACVWEPRALSGTQCQQQCLMRGGCWLLQALRGRT
jgi:hypothetical protein